MKTLPRLLLAIILFTTVPARAAGQPVVIASIAPLAWMVSALAPDNTTVGILIPPGQSPHDYLLKPDAMARLQQSALLVWVGPGLESSLTAAAATLPPGRSIALLPDSDSGHHPGHGDPDPGSDPHLWLDPLAMGEAAIPVARQLQVIWPDQAEAIAKRLQAFRQTMLQLDQALAVRFAPVSTQGFVVYHDGYQRWVQRYGLNQRAAVWHHEGIPTGARERAALLRLLDSREVKCLFYEPEHGEAEVKNWLGPAAAGIRLVRLDMLGESVRHSKDSYRLFLEDLSGRMAGCLAGDGK